MIKIQNKSDSKLSFETDMNLSLANAIRRHVNYIPILAIDSLEISENDSALYDEILAHRVGLVPLVNEKLKLPEDCDCKGKGCGKCSIKLKLKTEGPCVVYSTEFSPKDMILYKMPLALLDKEQKLELVGIAKVGKGVQHAKFSPGILHYRYSDDVDKKEVEEDEANFKKVLEDAKKNENKEIVVSIESWGQIKPKEIFIEAVEALNKNLKEFAKELK